MYTLILYWWYILITKIYPWTFRFHCYPFIHLWRDVWWTTTWVTVVLDYWSIRLVDIVVLEKHAFWLYVYLWVLVFGHMECFQLIIILSFPLVWHFPKILFRINFGWSSTLVFGERLWWGCWYLIGCVLRL
jgi:hypothetical protein